jgi:hypothetical protein
MSQSPTIAILGRGRAGKDTAGEWFGSYTDLVYTGSTSMPLCMLIATKKNIPLDVCWKSRHAEREYWYNFANELRANDPTLLARISLELGDMVIGLRDDFELQACKDAGLFDLVIWIERDVPVDPTLKFDSSACDIIIENNTTIPELHIKLQNLCKFAGLAVSSKPVGFHYDPLTLIQNASQATSFRV